MTTSTTDVQHSDFSLAITGSGGSGALTAGAILLRAAAQSGLYGFMTRSVGPQIRGGESASMVRLSSAPVNCLNDAFDLLVGLDWRNAGRFAQEIPLKSESLIMSDPAAGEVPSQFLSSGARVRELAFKQRTTTIEAGRINMVAVGAAGAFIGLPRLAVDDAVRSILVGKGIDQIEAASACVSLGYELTATEDTPTAIVPGDEGARWQITGNEACALGGLRGGVRFVAGYPITPASDILEWLAPRLEQIGGVLLQAEDELAAINMIIGASFGGIPALTATSGPGLSLMQEGLGLAVASETPVVVINVTRGGPSTGIPTKSEQSDLNAALYGVHGDAPHLVLAPLDVSDCVVTTEWAVRLAERLQTAAIVLSDQLLGQARVVIDAPAERPQQLERVRTTAPRQDYERYVLTEDGVSAMTYPGIAHGMYTADGLEHDERGIPSSLAEDHRRQLEKRQHKIEAFDYGPHWAKIHGSGDLCLICWGSSSGAVMEAATRLQAQDVALRVIALRLLAPLRHQELAQALNGTKQVWVIEQNHSGQLYHYLKGHDALPAEARLFARPGPIPLRPGEIVDALSGQAG